MTAQLPLMALPSDHARGTLLLALWFDGQPQRSATKCTCLGKPKPKPRARPDKLWGKWRDAMVADLRELGRPMIVEPVIAQVVAVFARPQRPRTTYRATPPKVDGVRPPGVTRPYSWEWDAGRVPFIGRPDFDNVWKAALDVTVRARLLADDSLVVGPAGGCARWYAAEGEDPHVEVRLWRA